MRILAISPQPFFTPRGTPFSVYYRTLVLAEQGAQIDLLTYGQGADADIPATRIVRIPRIPGIGHIPVGPSKKKLFLDILMILWTIGLLVRHRYAVVHAHEESVFWCRFLQPVFRFRLVYDMHSSLPQQLSNFRFTKSRWLIGTFRALEDTCLRKADAVITICPDLRDYALSVGVPPERHFLIENSIFDDVRLKQGVNAQAAAGNPEAEKTIAAIDRSRPLVLYAGTFESYQGVDIVIRAFIEVRRRVPAAQLLLVGGTPEQVAEMKQLAQQIGADCLFTGRVSKTTAMELNAAATVLLSPRRDGTNTPLKIYEQLASGKPLVATRIWSHTQVLTDQVCILVEPEPASIAAGIIRALESPEEAAALAARARALYDREYARPVYERKIKQLLERIA